MKKMLFLVLFLSITFWINGQVPIYYQPTIEQLAKVDVAVNSVVRAKKSNVEVNRMVLPSFDVHQLLLEDSINSVENVSLPYRFGKGFDTDLSLSKSGLWQNTNEGRVWTMHFYSPGAISLNFIFEDFHLPDSAELYIVNSDRTALYGPVTAPCIPENGFFLTDLVPGDNVSVLLFEPNASMGQSQLKITKVVHAYRGFSYNVDNETNSSDALASCHNDVACFPNWSTESDAVAQILLSDGQTVCSGALIMTADYSFKPYFLTAFHCLNSDCSETLSPAEQSAVNQWVFKFKFKNGCGAVMANAGISYNGAVLRAAYRDTDFALLELYSNLTNGSSTPSWLGWDRTGNTPSSGTYIHHPAGAPMKISFDYQPLYRKWDTLWWSICNESSSFPGNTHWKLSLDSGVVQGGSSGAPLLNQNKRIIGQHHGGEFASMSCSSTGALCYSGAFYRSWTGGGTTSTRLSNWLDPNGTGAVTTNTSYYPTFSGPSFICPLDNPHNYYVSNVPSAVSVTWTSTGGVSITPNGNYCMVNAITPGPATITAQLGNGMVFTKDIEVSSTTGNPYISYVYGGGNINLEINTPNIYGSRQFLWIASGSGSSYSFTADANLRTWAIPQGNYTIQCRVVTQCGHLMATTTITGSHSSISPNPVNHTLYINLPVLTETEIGQVGSTQQVGVSNSYELRLFDSQGSLVRSLHVMGPQTTLNVSSLPTGIYFLHIYKPGVSYPEVHKVVVSH